MERKLGHEQFLRLIPQTTLNKLEPFKGRLSEVFSQRADFAHLKYHTLDELSILRHCDKRTADIRVDIIRGISHGNIWDSDLEQTLG